MSNPDLIVMAAGIGSRYGGIKQIEPMGPNGEIILDYSIYDAMQAGFGKIIFVINRDIERRFRERMEKSIARHCEVVYIKQELENIPDGFPLPQERVKPWGTAHAVLSCRKAIDGPFAVINADDFYGRSAFQVVGEHLRQANERLTPYDFCMVAYDLKNTLTEHGHVARGICEVDPTGYLITIHERTKIKKFDGAIKYTEDGETWVEIPADSPASMNLWGFTTLIFAELEKGFADFLRQARENLETAEYFIPEVVNQLIEEQKATVRVLRTRERWFGVTYQADLDSVKKSLRSLIQQGVYPGKLWD